MIFYSCPSNKLEVSLGPEVTVAEDQRGVKRGLYAVVYIRADMIDLPEGAKEASLVEAAAAKVHGDRDDGDDLFAHYRALDRKLSGVAANLLRGRADAEVHDRPDVSIWQQAELQDCIRYVLKRAENANPIDEALALLGELVQIFARGQMEASMDKLVDVFGDAFHNFGLGG